MFLFTTTSSRLVGLRTVHKNAKKPSPYPASLCFTHIKLTSQRKQGIYWGVIMGNDLSFSSHINEICKKSTLAIRSIGRIPKYLSLDGLNALVISLLDYCNCLLYGIPKYQRDKLQQIQNTAARLVMGLNRSDHATPILKNLHWLTVEKRIEFNILLITHKTIHGQSVDYLNPLSEMYQQPSRSLKQENNKNEEEEEEVNNNCSVNSKRAHPPWHLSGICHFVLEKLQMPHGGT